MSGRTTHTRKIGDDSFELRTLGAGEGSDCMFYVDGLRADNPVNAVHAFREIRKLLVRDCVLITHEGADGAKAEVRTPLAAVFEERYAGPEGQRVIEQLVKFFLEINFKNFTNAGTP